MSATRFHTHMHGPTNTKFIFSYWQHPHPVHTSNTSLTGVYNWDGVCLLRGANDFINILYVNFSLYGLGMAQGQLPACHRGDLGSIHAWFAKDKVELRLFFLLRVFRFSLSLPFQQRSTLIFMYMLPLPEGQTGETWEPSKKQCYFGNRWAMGSNVLSLFLYRINKITPY